MNACQKKTRKTGSYQICQASTVLIRAWDWTFTKSSGGEMKVLNTQIRGRESGQKSHTKVKIKKKKKMHVYSATYKKWHIHGRKASLYVNIAGSLQIQKYTFTHKHILNPYKCPAQYFWSIRRKLKQPHTIFQAYKQTTFNWSCEVSPKGSIQGNKSSEMEM